MLAASGPKAKRSHFSHRRGRTKAISVSARRGDANQCDEDDPRSNKQFDGRGAPMPVPQLTSGCLGAGRLFIDANRARGILRHDAKEPYPLFRENWTLVLGLNERTPPEIYGGSFEIDLTVLTARSTSWRLPQSSQRIGFARTSLPARSSRPLSRPTAPARRPTSRRVFPPYVRDAP
jgi:hypothetical protein